MKALGMVLLACVLTSGAAFAEGMRGGPGGGGGQHGGWGPGGGGWGPNGGVFLDVPANGMIPNNYSSMPQKSDYEIRCSDARHSCFGQFGVNEPGYGNCMVSRGC